MNITKIYKEGNTIHAVEITDGDISYPVIVSALKNRTLFNALKENGWELRSLPYGFAKGSINMENLPSEDKPFNAFTEDEQMEMMEYDRDHMTEDELKVMIRSNEITTYKISSRPLIEASIQTRSELLKFLIDWRNGKISDLDKRYYMPLNSFTAPEALFTFEEYFNVENSEYVNIIKSRRKLTMKAYNNLCRDLIKHGLNSDFTASQLINEYLTWGLCGIKDQIIDKSQELSDRVISSQETSVTASRMNELALLDGNGQYHYRDNKGRNQGYLPVDISSIVEENIKKSRVHSSNLGVNAATAVLVSRPVANHVTHFVFENAHFKFDETNYRLSYRNSYKTDSGTFLEISDTVGIEKLRISGEKLDIYHNDYVIEETANMIMYNAIVDHIIDTKTVKTNVSTRNVLSQISAGISSQLSFFATRLANSIISEEASETVRQTSVSHMIRNLRSFITGNLQGELTEDEYNLLTDYLEGYISFDLTQQGILSDSNNQRQELVNNVRAAHEVLGIPVMDLYLAVRDLTMDTPFVKFENGKDDVCIIIELPKRDRSLEYYQADVVEYKSKQATQAHMFHYVTHAFREMGPDVNHFQHIGVRTLTFTKYKGHMPLYGRIRDIIVNHMQDTVAYNKHADLLRQMDLFVARAIFSIYFTKGRIKLSAGALDIDKAVDYNEVTLPVLNSVMPKFETIWGLIDYNISENSLESQHHFVNCTVLPDLVVPNKGTTIIESSPRYFWENLTRTPALFEKALSAGHFDNVTKNGEYIAQWTGGINHYEMIAKGGVNLPNTSDWIYQGICHWGDNRHDSYKKSRSFSSYMKWATENIMKFTPGEKGRRLMPYLWVLYPELYKEEIEEYESSEVMDVTIPKEYFFAGKTMEYTMKDAIKARPEYRDIFNPVVKKENDPNAIETVGKVIPFRGLTAEEIYILNDNQKVVKLTEFDAPMRFNVHPITREIYTYVNNEYVELPPSQIPMLDREFYAVKEIYNGMYLIEDNYGNLHRVRLN